MAIGSSAPCTDHEKRVWARERETISSLVMPGAALMLERSGDAVCVDLSCWIADERHAFATLRHNVESGSAMTALVLDLGDAILTRQQAAGLIGWDAVSAIEAESSEYMETDATQRARNHNEWNDA